MFVVSPSILSYFSVVAVQDSANDNTCISTIVLTEYVFMAGAMFVATSRDKSNLRYNTLIPRFDKLSGRRVVSAFQQEFRIVQVPWSVPICTFYAHRPCLNSFYDTSMFQNRLDKDSS